MAGVQVVLVHRPVGMMGHGVRISLYGAPEVAQQAISIVDGFRALEGFRPREQAGPRAEKGLDVIPAFAKPIPDFLGDPGLAPEVGEG